MLRLFFFIGLCLICWSCFTQEAGSFNNLDEISKKVDQVQNLCYENKREQAKALLQKLELLSGSDIIVDTSQYAYALSLIAKGYTDMGEMILALKLYNQANTFIVKGLYKNDSLFSVNLGYIAQIYFYQRNYDSATLVIKKALGIQEKKLGKQNRAYAKSLVIFANIEVDLGNYEHAILLAEESKKILESKVGIENLDYANNLTVLAKANSYSGNYSIAEPMLFEAMHIQEKLKEANSIERAHSLSTLANLYTDNGNYEAADSLFTQALFVVGKILGKQSLEYSSILSDNALLFRLTGRFEKAEEALLHDKAICELKLGKEHLDYSTACNNLALFYQDMGNYELAEPLYVESKDLTEKLVGKETPDYSTMLNNLGYLYHEMGLYSKAVLLNLEDKNLCPKVFGKNNPACVTSLYHLADAYYEQGKYRNADSLYAEVIARWKKYFGTSNPDYARSLYSYGKLQMAMNNLTVADSLLSEAKRIQEKVEGKESPDYLPTCIVLSKLYERQGKWQVSEKLQQEIQRIQFANLIKSVSYLSVNELAKYIRSFEQTNDLLYSFLVHRILSQKPVGLLTELAFDYLLFYKGFLLSSANKLNVLGGLSKDASELNQKRKMYYRLLSKEYSKPVIERDLKIVKDLQDKANTIEKQLTKMVSGYSGFSTQVHWLDLKLKLKPGEAVAEFVSFRKEFPVVSDSVMYAVEILKYGSSSPEFIFLCEQKSIDSILHSDNERKSDYVNELYTISGRGAVSLEARSRSLYELFWEPIEKSLEGIKTIYFSPAGLLHRINLDAIPVSETETLADRYQLIQLNSTRQVVISDTVKSDNIDAVLYGGINFEKDSMSKDEEPALVFMAPRDGSTSGSNGINRGESWNYLPGTDREVHSIEKILKIAGLTVTSYRAFSATEESFKSIGTNGLTSPKIIHIATHGFFFADQKVKTTKSQVEGNKGQQDVVFKISDQPMLRSGLIMAGSNAAWQGKQTLEGREDGVLTAYEISQMNLSNTELVVLSACETGLGDIQGNEGVYGLQRAFKIAGVKYIIMSLWQVPDKQTTLLMTTFYKKWLESENPSGGGNKTSIPQAFQAAQKELREIGLDPYQWAGFVLIQ